MALRRIEQAAPIEAPERVSQQRPRPLRRQKAEERSLGSGWSLGMRTLVGRQLRGEGFEAAELFVTADDDEAVVGLNDGLGRGIERHFAVGLA